ncbi:MAG: 3'(2'),5'-bisphosphate nucleotidase CysQ [Gammaproteobacteria bacterium]|nr:3'(2'),5'-bisphosphate nucleotidase CysQ [Gammaproteobacteria bacterium]
MQNRQQLLKNVVAITREAGQAILEVYQTDFDVANKQDDSPITAADRAAHDIIVDGLKRLTPDLPVLSEEDGVPAYGERSAWQRYWLVDPLDGTKEFVSRNGEFTVNIALVEGHHAVLGVVHVPVQAKTYTGLHGYGARRIVDGDDSEAIRVAEESASPVRVVGSRSHRGASLDAWLEALGDYELVPMGSSLKFCIVAEGGADVYPRLGPTSEWDTAAAQAVVEAAGGRVTVAGGAPLTYNAKADILNPHFLVTGPQDRQWPAIG